MAYIFEVEKAMFTGKAKIAGVIGCPVTHSLSPKLHNYWLQHYGIDGVYIPLEVTPANLGSVLAALPKMGIKGVNITVPHKEAVMEHMDEISMEARRIGAVNTVIVNEEGRLKGYNTDWEGFLQNVAHGAPASWGIKAGKAVVIGAGGAAKAVIAALQGAAVPEIILINRTRTKAEETAAHLGGNITILDWDQREAALEGANLLVNTTSLGMMGQPLLKLALDALPRAALVTDIVYKPLETELLRAARKRGNPVVDGLGMLLYQAVPGFEAWFGVRPVVTDTLRDYILA
jgi:shikimate dehydrogenase